MRALLAGFLLTVLPAGAQWKLPDNLAPLAPGAKACNDAGTHCIVNAADLMARDVALFLADGVLAAKDRQIEDLQTQLQNERDDRVIEQLQAKHPRCACVCPIPPGPQRKG